jgi:hypothetical protein
MSTHYLSLRADFQHELRLILLLPLVCCAEQRVNRTPMLTTPMLTTKLPRHPMGPAGSGSLK